MCPHPRILSKILSIGRSFVSVYIFYIEINSKFGFQGLLESTLAHKIAQVKNDKSAMIDKKIGNILPSLVALPLSPWLVIGNIDSGAPAARRAAKRSPILIWETKGNPWVDFLMVIMASGIAHGRVRTTTTTTATMTVESRKMAAILQIIGWQRHVALVYCVLLWYWTSMLWSTDSCQNKVSADQYHVAISRAQVYSSSRKSIFWSGPLTKCWFFD